MPHQIHRECQSAIYRAAAINAKVEAERNYIVRSINYTIAFVLVVGFSGAFIIGLEENQKRLDRINQEIHASWLK